jgi:hypothetical protein
MNLLMMMPLVSLVLLFKCVCVQARQLTFHGLKRTVQEKSYANGAHEVAHVQHPLHKEENIGTQNMVRSAHKSMRLQLNSIS